MGKTTGFMDYRRAECPERAPAQRIGDFRELRLPLGAAERRRQSGRCMDCGVPFCQAGAVFEGRLIGCPLHNLIPGFNDLLWRDTPELALARLLKTNCFPEFTGRVCPAMCEAACNCGLYGSPVTVRDNELYIIEYAFENGLMEPSPPPVRSGRRAAVIGSGPAGLSAAYWLNRRGHSVTVFERDAEPGGLLTYGIPSMKLPRAVVSRRAELMEREGVTFRTGIDVGRELDPHELEREYDCVILCCGAQKPRRLEYEGEASEGIYYALEYLRAASHTGQGTPPVPELDARGRNVVVIGAGDSASDCVATALRQGCASIRQLIRKPKSWYPSAPPDYAHEEAEAVTGSDIRRFETRVLRVEAGENGALSSVTAVSPSGEEKLPAELLVIASGFSGPEDRAEEDFAGVSAIRAGDMLGGSSLVALAIADGRRAAADADADMMGYTNI